MAIERPSSLRVRVARWILGVTGAVVLLAVAAALIATLVINPDRYRGRIESAVQRATGRPFLLEGHLRLTWFPWLGLHMGAARLGTRPGEAAPDLLDWQSANLSVRLLPLLLHRRLEVGRIRIVGADIHLRRGPRGETSWDDLIARLRGGGAATATPAPADRAAAAWPVTLAGVDVENGSLDYIDERSLEHVSLSDWRLSVGPWHPAEPLAVSTSFLLRADTSGSPTMPGALRLPPEGVHVSLDVPRLQIKTSATRAVEVLATPWSLRVADAKLQGDIDASRDAAGGLTAEGALTAAVPSLRGLARTLGIGLPDLADPAALRALSLSGSWRYRDGTLEVKPLAAKLDSTTVSGWAAHSARPRPLWTFALRADHVDFGRYLTRDKEPRPPELPVTALRALPAQGTLELGSARIDGTTLKDMRLQVQ